MPSTVETAEQRFREAFQRLKANSPRLLPRGSSVSQNNVAKEAGTDPTALRKSRYPALIREIQAWIEINDAQESARQVRQNRRRERDDVETKLKSCMTERDHAQSQLVSSHRKVLELLQENARLQARLNDFLPPATPLE
jgi:hypothetical protein